MDDRMNRHYALLFEGCIHTLLDEGESRERKAEAELQLMEVAFLCDDWAAQEEAYT
jgi:hypothetical protein